MDSYYLYLIVPIIVIVVASIFQMIQRRRSEPLITQYRNLLFQYRDPDAEPVQKFVAEHSNNEVFLRRVKVLNRAFKISREPHPIG